MSDCILVCLLVVATILGSYSSDDVSALGYRPGPPRANSRRDGEIG